MSYETENVLPSGVRQEDVAEVLGLLGYVRRISPRSRPLSLWWQPRATCIYDWFEERDYRSYTGVACAIVPLRSRLAARTRTSMARSHWDLVHQNRTARLLRKYLGGYFTSDIGKNRCWREDTKPPHPAEAGCHLAFERFGSNLFLVRSYLDRRAFRSDLGPYGVPLAKIFSAPHVLANNLLLPFLVSAVEDYFRSAYVALLRYSPRRDAILRGARISGDPLVGMAEGGRTVESTIAETISFQSISSVCSSFRSLDSSLDFARELKRPYRRRKIALFDALTALVSDRHRLVHRATLAENLDDARIEQCFDLAEQAVTRCHLSIFHVYGWEPDPGWTRNLFDAGHRRRMAKQRAAVRRLTRNQP
ncbi:MAG TPA: hypothetical protein VEA99_19885 [Gemmatimonadaceae bacterium]|nr:hypothetical protein [Gemmatimonadaceae bacterium]